MNECMLSSILEILIEGCWLIFTGFYILRFLSLILIVWYLTDIFTGFTILVINSDNMISDPYFLIAWYLMDIFRWATCPYMTLWLSSLPSSSPAIASPYKIWWFMSFSPHCYQPGPQVWELLLCKPCKEHYQYFFTVRIRMHRQNLLKLK